MAATDPDLALRQAAVAHARRLVELYDDLVPLTQLRVGLFTTGCASASVRFRRASTAPRSSAGLLL